MTLAAVHSRFSYQARDQRGQTVNGFVSALTLADATKSLRAEGKYIVDIKPARAGATTADPTARDVPLTVGRNSSVNREELIYFTMQLSVMVDTGVPLSDALTSLSEQTFSETFMAVVKSIVQDVTGGKDFSSTLEHFPRVFPKYYISLVRASELSGTMGPMLRKLADYLVSQRETAKKVKGALIYPGFMMIMSVSVTIFLLTCILPKFTAIFASRKAASPASHARAHGHFAFVDVLLVFLARRRNHSFRRRRPLLPHPHRTPLRRLHQTARPHLRPHVSKNVPLPRPVDHGHHDHLRRADARLPRHREGSL